MDGAASFEITIADSGERFTCRAGQNVLAAMERLGRRGIPVGCRGGGCGVCRVQVVGGRAYRTGCMSRAQVSREDELEGICLACKLIPEGDLTVRPLGLLHAKLAPSGVVPAEPRAAGSAYARAGRAVTMGSRTCRKSG